MENDDQLIDDYWRKKFSNKSIVGDSDSLHVNIARTKAGKQVSNEVWDKTIKYIIKVLNIGKQTKIMELCCGNGLLLGEIALLCESAIGVDYSEELINQFKRNFINDNLSLYVDDVRFFNIKKASLDVIIIYFSMQHFNERNTFLLIEKSIKGLKLNGKILIGDIPDLDKKWSYIDKPKYHKDYFKRVVENTPKIGYWFQKAFFLAMNDCFEGVTFKILDQPSYQINSDHCFDVLIEKNES